MQITIGAYDPDTRTVPVTFSAGGITHNRSVNACHDEDGAYDVLATEERVEDVARGVATKIAAGAIREPAPAPELTDAEPQEAGLPAAE